MIFSQEAEIRLIACCLLNSRLIDESAGIVSSRDFYFPLHRTGWAWITQQHTAGAEVELIGLADHLAQHHDEAEYGGLTGLAEMVRNSEGSASAIHYAKAIKDKSRRRQFQAVLGELEDMALDTHQDFKAVVDSAQARVSNLLGDAPDEVGAVGDWIHSYLDTLEKKYSGDIDPMGILWNLPDIDRMTNGFHKKDLVILAGESGMGKTVVASHIMDSVSLRQGKPAIMFQLEMDRGPVLNRIIGSHSGVKLDALKNPREHMDDEGWSKLGPAMLRCKESPMVIDDRPGMTMAQVRSAARRWHQVYGEIGVIIIDHVGIVGIDDKAASREQQIAEVTRQAKVLAKDLDTTVILLAQINRDNKVRKDKRPILSDLRESAALQHNADLVVFVYRDEAYHEDTQDQGIAELIVAKQRDGQVGTAKVICDLSRSQLKPLTAEAFAEYRREFPMVEVERDEHGFQL